MNIAIMIPELGGGGAEKVAQRLGRHYKDQGNQVYYFVLDTHQRRVFSVEGEIVNTGLTSCIVDVNHGIREVIWRLLVSSNKIRALKRHYKIDASISFMEECNYLNILSQRGEKVIVRVCTILSQREDLNPYLCSEKMISFFYSLPCRIVVLSRYAVEEMTQHYHISGKKLTLIPNMSDGNLFKKDQNSTLYGKHCIVAVGRLDPVKQQERLIRAFSYVVDKVTDAELLIVGTGPNERYLKGLCRKYKIEDKVHFLGFQRDVAKFLCMSKVFVMSSVVEGFPNSMIEAMSCGIPVVSVDCPGGCADILGEKIQRCGYWMCRYGILTPRMPRERVKTNEDITKEESILGRAIVEILTNEKLQRKYSIASQVRADMYRADKVIKKWDRIVRR